MPNIWTHLIFGQELLTHMGHTNVMNDKQLKHVLSLGCQGPDFLFYHNFLPWKKDKKLSTLGSSMHTDACGPFLLDLVRQVQGRGLYNPAVLYVLGFLTHHILDRNMHPYVFYKSGFKKWNHQRFEVIMDTIVLKRKRGLSTWETPVWKEIYVGEAFPLGIVPALSRSASKHYPVAADLSENDWNDAYRDMIRAQKLFHDPSGIKRLLTLGQIAPFVYTKKPAPLDYMNEAKAVWNCPTSLAETYTYSVWDLWDIALEDGLTVLHAAIRALQSGKDADFAAFSHVLGNRSYETGKPCGEGHEIVHVQPII
ncbi:zinc dependent phospholipase C family protein [Paenibacillus aestuarii]|uniref:Zinc dependent phospholipase C family protein n=1 Tax=Paenibacillus aestuarii TaxID=516965 RepID=A0ABW0KIV7_9BACL|nr:zinc dependent phospholipase C family protein [Paenibacillus aestuarii]